MNLHLRTTIILLITLSIGVGIGFVLSGIVARQRISDMRERLQGREGFARHLQQVLDLETHQQESVGPILKKYQKRFQANSRQFNQSMRALMDSLHQELSPYLSQSQLDRLQRFKKRRIRARPRRPGPKPPP